ncbi:MAG: extracellular solute-binding protein [Chloroflexi bacterium]|nr:extracellular solute-binding protein [Chloroflexota bacterium]
MATQDDPCSGGSTRRMVIRGSVKALTAGPLAAALTTTCGPLRGGEPAMPAAVPAAVRIAFHWAAGSPQGQAAQRIIDDYNGTQGRTEKITVGLETVPWGEMQDKLTVGVAGGDPPEVWNYSASPRTFTKSGLAVAVPREDEQYVKQQYVPGAVEMVTAAGKVVGYPTEFQPLAHFYRKAYYQEDRLSRPPANTDEVFEYATKLTRKAGGVYSRFGFALAEGIPFAWQLNSMIGRFGGQMYTFAGDRPVKIDVASPEAVAAVGWWRRLVESGVTQVGQMGYAGSWQQGFATASEHRIWFPILQLRALGYREIFEDLGATVPPPKQGLKPFTSSYGLALMAPKGAKQPEARWRLVRWLMHKPAMPFSRFIVEVIGSAPAPKDYPAQIPGWTDDLIKAFAVDSPRIARADPTDDVLSTTELNAVAREFLLPIVRGDLGLLTGLQQVNAKLNEILKRNYPAS